MSMFMYMWNVCVYEGDHMHVEVSTCVFIHMEEMHLSTFMCM